MISAASQPPVSPLQALGLLFDPSVSAVQLVDINVTGPRTIEAQWRMGGYLRFPCEWLTMVGLLGAVGSCAAAVQGGAELGLFAWQEWRLGGCLRLLCECSEDVACQRCWGGCGGQHHTHRTTGQALDRRAASALQQLRHPNLASSRCCRAPAGGCL